MADAITDPQRSEQWNFRRYYGDERATACHAHDDGDCFFDGCPQLRDGEPKASGRHCPLDVAEGNSDG